MLGKYITIGDKEYLLKITFNGMIEMMNKYPDIQDRASKGELGIDVIRVLLFYQLKNKENDLKKLKLDDAGDLMTEYIEDGGNFLDLVETITNVQMECLGLNQKDVETVGEQTGEE